MKRSFAFPFHSFLFAIFPVISLAAANFTEIHPADALRSLVITAAAGILLPAIIWLICRNIKQAAAFSTILIFLFFFYGRAYEFLQTHPIIDINLGRHRFLVVLFLILAVLLIFLVSRIKDFQNLTIFLNLVGAAAVILPLATLTMAQLQTYAAKAAQLSTAGKGSTVSAASNPTSAARKPDIYYIILDAYTRDDVLAKYGYDNSAYTQNLEKLGFYIPKCAQSNYSRTEYSLTSSLNLNYVSEVLASGNGQSAPTTEKLNLAYYLKNNTVMATLRSLGYSIVTFQTDFPWSELDNADRYITLNSGQWDTTFAGYLNKFEAQLINSSALIAVRDFSKTTTQPQSLTDNENADLSADEGAARLHYEIVMHALDTLDELPGTPGPKFVFAHIVSPHPPCVFDPNGKFSQNSYKDCYFDQVSYLNKRMIAFVNTAIQNSKTPPIIIIQGDHGIYTTLFDRREYDKYLPDFRMAIQNVYYVPDDIRKDLYPAITPVNTFRLIFSHLFGMDYPRIADQSYFAKDENGNTFVEVPNTCN